MIFRWWGKRIKAILPRMTIKTVITGVIKCKKMLSNAFANCSSNRVRDFFPFSNKRGERFSFIFPSFFNPFLFSTHSRLLLNLIKHSKNATEWKFFFSKSHQEHCHNFQKHKKICFLYSHFFVCILHMYYLASFKNEAELKKFYEM